MLCTPYIILLLIALPDEVLICGSQSIVLMSRRGGARQQWGKKWRSEVGRWPKTQGSIALVTFDVDKFYPKENKKYLTFIDTHKVNSYS